MIDANKKVIDKVKHGLETTKNSQRLLLQDICNFSLKMLDYDFDSTDFHFYMRNLLKKAEELKDLNSQRHVFESMNDFVFTLKEDLEDETALD